MKDFDRICDLAICGEYYARVPLAFRKREREDSYPGRQADIPAFYLSTMFRSQSIINGKGN